MKYSYNWLKELSKTKKTPDQLAEMVMLKGFEFEEKVELGARFEKFVVGQIQSLAKHPNADKLQLASVDIGAKDKKPIEVVCGAWNIQVGDKVPVALVGAVVPLNKIKVEAREVRGVVSNGMLCAEDELALGKDHSGIMILEQSAKVGQPLAAALGLDDTVLDFSILPNRAHDCLSHVGMAREICAMEGMSLPSNQEKLPAVKKGKNLTIDIIDKKLCPRYIGVLLKNITVKASPGWMQSRLVSAGMEPINNVVDITNYVMLELGNPLHAFDARKVQGKNDKVKGIVVRRAERGEALELLDGKGLELAESDLVIADKEKILALAGIKGGKHSGIGSDTTEIILESANFNAYSIRKTRQRHNLATESQARFEKSISPALTEKAALRAIELLEKYAGAKVAEIVDADNSAAKPQEVTLDITRVPLLLGMPVEKDKMTKILTNLGFTLKGKSEKALDWEVPSWRLDIEGPEDLIEEVGRIIGYEKIDERPIIKDISLPMRNEKRKLEWKIKDILVGLGFDEMINNSFYSPKDAELFAGGEHLELENPLAPELSLMRKTLLPGIFSNVSTNEKYFDRFSLFEIGRVYTIGDDDRPEEELKISGALYDASLKDEELFYALKGKIEAWLENIAGQGRLKFQSLEDARSRTFQVPRTAVIMIDNRPLGAMGIVHTQAKKQYGIKKSACSFEIDFEELVDAKMGKVIYKPARRFPEVKRDISMFVPYKTETDSVIDAIEETAGETLLHTDLFDVYLDKEQGRKSLAFHLTFGSNDRTLESGEVDRMMAAVMQTLEKTLQAQVRK